MSFLLIAQNYSRYTSNEWYKVLHTITVIILTANVLVQTSNRKIQKINHFNENADSNDMISNII